MVNVIYNTFVKFDSVFFRGFSSRAKRIPVYDTVFRGSESIGLQDLLMTLTAVIISEQLCLDSDI